MAKRTAPLDGSSALWCLEPAQTVTSLLESGLLPSLEIYLQPNFKAPRYNRRLSNTLPVTTTHYQGKTISLRV